MNNPTDNKIVRWLLQKIDDDDIYDEYSPDGACIPNYWRHCTQKDFNKYYKPNDIEIKKSRNNLISIIETKEENGNINSDMEYIDSCMEQYGDTKILIPPNTNLYHAKYLLKSMVDCAHTNDYKYTYFNGTDNTTIRFDLIDKNIKNAFYRFCYKHTTNKNT